MLSITKFNVSHNHVSLLWRLIYINFSADSSLIPIISITVFISARGTSISPSRYFSSQFSSLQSNTKSANGGSDLPLSQLEIAFRLLSTAFAYSSASSFFGIMQAASAVCDLNPHFFRLSAILLPKSNLEKFIPKIRITRFEKEIKWYRHFHLILIQWR